MEAPKAPQTVQNIISSLLNAAQAAAVSVPKELTAAWRMMFVSPDMQDWMPPGSPIFNSAASVWKSMCSSRGQNDISV